MKRNKTYICTLEGMSAVKPQNTVKWYGHEPVTAIQNKEATILWGMQMHIDREIHVQQTQQSDQRLKLINMAVPKDSNISSKFKEKLLKWKNLKIEITRNYVRAARNRCFRAHKEGKRVKHTEKVPGSIRISELQKNNICYKQLRHILMKVPS